MWACGERLDRSSAWVLGVTWGKEEETSEKERRLNLFPLPPPSSKIYSPLTPKEGPILCLLKLENFQNMRLSPDPKIFSAPDLKPAVGKIQSRCQWKHIVIHVTIIWLDVRATCARVWGEWEWTFFALPYAHLQSREIAPGLPWCNTLATATIVTRKSSLFYSYNAYVGRWSFPVQDRHVSWQDVRD